MIISIQVAVFFCWFCGCFGSPLPSTAAAYRAVQKPIALEEKDDDDLREKESLRLQKQSLGSRNLGLKGRDPTGFLVRYVGCPVEDDTNVVLEVCPTYQRGGVFGGSCTRQLSSFLEWVKFHHNIIVLHMLQDFCDVCSDECPFHEWENTPYAERSSGNKFPDICNTVYEYGYDETACDQLCDTTDTSRETNKRGGGKVKQSAIVDECKEEGTWGRYSNGYSLDSFGCSSGDFWRRRMKGDDDDSEAATTCLLEELYVEWTDSNDEPGYPTMVDEIQHRHGQAFLQCSFVDEDESENDGTSVVLHCQDFYCKQLQPCALQEPTEWYHHLVTPSPTSTMCRLATVAPRPTPSTITAAPSEAQAVEEAESPPSFRNFFMGCVVVGAVVALWYRHRRGQSQSVHWDLVPELDLELMEEPRQQQDETPYHQVVEMRDVGGASTPLPPTG